MGTASTNPAPEYSIVIPAYNEIARIDEALRRVTAYVEAQGWRAEVIVVDDGSTDGTSAAVERWMGGKPYVRLLHNPGNRGKGYSVRHGMLEARGGIVMFSDADFSAPIEEAPLLFAALAAGADVAIGSRWLERTRQMEKQPLYRRFFSRCFNLVTRLIINLPYADTQCGFKAFTREAAQRILKRQRIEGWGFDPEVLYLARRFGYKVAEVPVSWGHNAQTNINFFRAGSRMLGEMVTIRWNAVRGVYKG